MLMAMSISNFPWKGITKVNLILFYPMKIQNIMELLNFMYARTSRYYDMVGLTFRSTS